MMRRRDDETMLYVCSHINPQVLTCQYIKASPNGWVKITLNFKFLVKL